ncbi:hypothetical protein F383_18937 [Gossypium arboreum]|uniref:Uncharacterized protein n=1 Tax=Gossypium arboreum TaxID=29729 RepID=A0A0B0NPV1_GOSAR|nr:hypothetical protein F383_18937 [Gossypium arboreum]
MCNCVRPYLGYGICIVM